MLRILCRLALFVVVAGAFPSAAQRWGVLLDGHPLPALAPAGTRVVVLFFVASDCPVSNRTFPEMQHLRLRFQRQGVRTYFVYPNQGEVPADVAAHQRAFDAGGDVLLDPAGTLVRLTGAVATPEVAVLVPEQGHWQPVYAGRVDNRYVRLGLERPAATEFYGEEAVEAVLAGKRPKLPAGQPVGCAIMNPGVR